MRRFSIIFLLVTTLLGAVSCIKEQFDTGYSVPEGEPVTMYLSFGAEEEYDVSVGTKAEASRVDESRVHDLYVLIFCPETGGDGGKKLYGRYFTYEHLIPELSTLVNQKNEGWYVDNVTVSDITSNNATLRNKQTQGVVKISTESKENCTLVVLTNLTNTVTSLDGKDALQRLSEIQTLEELKGVKVKLEQNVVNRNDLFLMLGTKTVNTGDMVWGSLSGTKPTYNETYQIPLTKLDAKVKFRITHNTANIDAVTPRYWQVFKVPEWSYLIERPISDENLRDIRNPEEYFNAQSAYFEGKETENGVTYDVFCFYMLENRQTPKKSIEDPTVDGSGYESKYYLRELQQKTPDPDPEHSGSVINGDWIFARQEATYVQFDLILTLSSTGIQLLGDTGMAAALTSEALFTVHLGDFTANGFDDYKTERGHSYIYDITVNNSQSISIEVRGDDGQGRNRFEIEPGQEGSLLLTTDGIINSDCHYEYHSLDFRYNPELGADNANDPLNLWPARKKVSWYVKTPFYTGGAEFNEGTGLYEMPAGADVHPDYQWIYFSLNNEENGKYLTARKEYPGLNDTDKRSNYNPNWVPSNDISNVPELMDINQLINFIFIQNSLRYISGNNGNNLFDDEDHIRITAYINEYYYEQDPRTFQKNASTHATDPWSGELNPNLWREFVNARPRELHILSNTQISEDRRSDVIVSSHSIIQQSIQTIYNIYAPDLTSLWGIEHDDELAWKHLQGSKGWPWWSGGSLPAGSQLFGDDDNGRLNTAGIWGLASGTEQQWTKYMKFDVENDTPELRDQYFYQAYSCMTRNRDNNGDGVIDQDELRWYTASVNQLVGMWIGNEALSLTARLYQPKDETSTGDDEASQLLWRSETVSSTCTDINNPRIIRAEEGATKSNYTTFWGKFNASIRDKVTSVRCVRNVGTYQDKGTTKEISEAPFDKMVDQYYDFEAGQDPNGKAWPNSDGSYTILFSRLNSKAIREYTAEDLPYHEEYSMNNRVYLRLTAQNKDDRGSVTDYGKQRIMNANITVHNDYCPPGYRVPNMTELLMMVSLLPRDYWIANKLYPCRSYYSRGYLGSRRTTGETGKIGWTFDEKDFRVHMQNDGDACTDIRCVRDDNMIGDITGQISVTDSDHRRKGQDMDIDLYFHSMASVIQSVILKVCYTDASGNKREVELSNDGLNLLGTELRQTITRVLPAGIPVFGFMTVRAIVRNAAGIERTFDAPIRVVSELYTSIKLLPCEYTGSVTNTFPILITASHKDQDVTSWELRVTSPDKRTTRETISTLGSGTTYSSTIYHFNPGTLQEGTYTFQLEAVSGGLTTRSEEVSMDVLKVNYNPTQGVNYDNIHEAADLLPYKWKREMVEGLDFSAGDFIETNMDVNHCVYKPNFSTIDKAEMELDKYTYYRKEGDQYYKIDETYFNGHPDEQYYYLNGGISVGLDNLISFGVSDIDWTNWSFHVFYPAVPSGETTGTILRFNPVWNGGYEGCNYVEIDRTKPLYIRLDKEGIYWNGKKMELSQFSEGNRTNVQEVLDRLTAAKTLYVGSVGGGTPAHISRATYRFVRVVYNGQFSTTSSSNSNFLNNPVYGGNL